MKVSYVGNFAGVPHSTESHVAQGFRALGHEVVEHQEDRLDWSTLADDVAGSNFALWTHTEGLAGPRTYAAQRKFLNDVRIPTAVIHLDLWHGINRANLVNESPHFRCDLVCTADGGHDAEWEASGVNHHWLPPGVSEFECAPGKPSDEYRSEIAFVGSWQDYHRESHHRFELVNFLRRRYGNRCAFWPKKGQHAVRGEPLRDLYASVDVAVGDSCMVGQISRYASDRVPESIGRGAFLLHPHVEGITDGGMYVDGKHMRAWRAFDWEALAYLIDYYLDHPDERAEIAAAGREHTLEHHTYTVRARQLLDLLSAEDLL